MLHDGCVFLRPEFQRHARAQLGRVRRQMGFGQPASGTTTAAPAPTRGESVTLCRSTEHRNSLRPARLQQRTRDESSAEKTNENLFTAKLATPTATLEVDGTADRCVAVSQLQLVDGTTRR